MARTDSELALTVHRRARRALLAALNGLNAMNGSNARAGTATSVTPSHEAFPLDADAVHQALTLAALRTLVLLMGRARGLFANPGDLLEGRLFRPQNAALDLRVELQAGELTVAFPASLAHAEGAFRLELVGGLAGDGVDFAACPAELVGTVYELLLGERVCRSADGVWELSSGARRKQTGTFFTPRALTEVVVQRALEPLDRRIRDSAHRAHDFVLDFRVCDPAVGGGAFLLEVARALAARAAPGSPTRTLADSSEATRRREIVTRVLHGVDINPTAVAVAEAALYLFAADPRLRLSQAGKNLHVGDALIGAPYRGTAPARSPASDRLVGAGLDFPRQFPEVFERGGFDLVIGNPPWVAYAGRAAQPLDPARKAYFHAHYSALRGYPTLHGLFVERALHLAPQGTVALVVPSPIADLDGYRAVRRAVRAGHTPCEPMLEFGQDAFESVTQPCFALIAEAATGSALPGGARPEADHGAPFRLAERQRAGALAVEVNAPSALSGLSARSAFPRELFGEMGFQSNGIVTRALFLRAPSPDPRHSYPLLEGRDVREFTEGEPRLFLAPDRQVLQDARCRLRDADEYRRVRFVVRQTARYPIAALHRGLPFRNSLLAGFESAELPSDLVVGLLNSTLYRALHLASRRDARQAVFPQVKVAHLRALPEPPADRDGRALVAALSAELSRAGVQPALTERLDAAVFALFSVGGPCGREITDFVRARARPRALSD